MKVLLMDLDISTRRKPSPNLALMKLSSYHKAKGDEVYLNFPLQRPNITYASCVFTWNAKQRANLPEGVIVGGSGLDLKAELPLEVEHIMPDYSLYPGINYSMGFTSRGCIRKCPWCIVPEKEGGIKPMGSIYEFWDRRHEKLVLLDNNILASPNWNETADSLIREQVKVDFNQGLDIRLVDDKLAYQLSKVNTNQLRFAFDNINIEPQVRQGIDLLVKADIKPRHLSFYMLVGFKGDAGIDRLKLLQSYGVDIYPMIYKDEMGKEPKLDIKFDETLHLSTLHGGRGNLSKFLRMVNRI